MKALANQILRRFLALLLSVTLVLTQNFALAQTKPAFTQQELDQMLAPIALYPDSLLSQILMASTYPLELVEASRWSKAHPELKGEAAVQAVAGRDWDPSVKSLLAFPQVLEQMDQQLGWTRALGDAFLAYEPQVMETVQNLRQKAQAAGNLQSNDRIRVVEDERSLVVEPANPQLIYVPYYDPRVVYGPWWWPAYPPIYWGPWPGYYVRPGFSAGFYWGIGIGISRSFFFGAFDWRQRHVRVVNANNYYYSKPVIDRRPIVNRGPNAWQHDPLHRRGVDYRDAALRQHYGRTSARPAEPHDSRGSGLPAPGNRGGYDEHRGSGTETRGTRPDTHESRGGASEIRRQSFGGSQAPRMIAPRTEFRGGYSEMRRQFPGGANAPRVIAPGAEFRVVGREPRQNANAGWRADARGFGDRGRPAFSGAPARAHGHG
jgi:hypothetical protein